MTWTYSGDPGASQLDELRFWVQDTDLAVQLLTDEECRYLLAKWFPVTDSIVFTAAVACEVVSAKFAGEVSVSADGVSVSTSELQEKYLRLAARLREQYKSDLSSSATPIVSGVMWDTEWDSSIKPLVFGVGSMDNYEVGRQDYGNYDPGSPTWLDEVSSAAIEVGSDPDAAGLLGP